MVHPLRSLSRNTIIELLDDPSLRNAFELRNHTTPAIRRNPHRVSRSKPTVHSRSRLDSNLRGSVIKKITASKNNDLSWQRWRKIFSTRLEQFYCVNKIQEENLHPKPYEIIVATIVTPIHHYFLRRLKIDKSTGKLFEMLHFQRRSFCVSCIYIFIFHHDWNISNIHTRTYLKKETFLLYINIEFPPRSDDKLYIRAPFEVHFFQRSPVFTSTAWRISRTLEQRRKIALHRCKSSSFQIPVPPRGKVAARFPASVHGRYLQELEWLSRDISFSIRETGHEIRGRKRERKKMKESKKPERGWKDEEGSERDVRKGREREEGEMKGAARTKEGKRNLLLRRV